MELVYFILCAYGMTSIVVYSHLFETTRKKISDWSNKFCELVNCPMCIGFWAGVFLWGINNYTELFTFDHSVATGFLLGCLSSGTSYILCMVVDDEGLKIRRTK